MDMLPVLASDLVDATRVLKKKREFKSSQRLSAKLVDNCTELNSQKSPDFTIHYSLHEIEQAENGQSRRHI